MNELLDRVVAPSERGRPDWQDVLAIAGVRHAVDSPSRRLSLRRPRYFAVAAAAAIAVVLATPAFGVRGFIESLVTRHDQDYGQAAIAPTVVQRDFSELAIGAPKGMDPRVLPMQTRLVARVRLGGRERNLWVAPTQGGGFCFAVEGAYGGCERKGGHLPPISLTVLGSGNASGDVTAMTHIGGTVTSPRITTLLIEFRDGIRIPIEFTYVSAPITAGFFGYDIPQGRRGNDRPVALIGLDRGGGEVWRENIRQ